VRKPLFEGHALDDPYFEVGWQRQGGHALAELRCTFLVVFDEEEAQLGFDPCLMLQRRLQRDDRRSILAVVVDARTGKAIDVRDRWEAAKTKNRRPRLKVASKDFVFRSGVWLQRPHRLRRRGHALTPLPRASSVSQPRFGASHPKYVRQACGRSCACGRHPTA
jgi:hypothetical protein